MDTNELRTHAPGFLGALTAVFLLRDTWFRRALLLISGWGASIVLGRHVALWLSMDAEPAGYLTGLFSMAISAKIFEVLDALPTEDLWKRLMNRVGL